MLARTQPRQRSRNRATFWPAVVVFMMMLSLLSTLSSPVSAQPTEPPVEEAPVEPTMEPVVQSTEPPVAQPTEAPVTEPTEDPVALPPLHDPAPETPPETPPVDDLGQIAVLYYVCPPGTDLTAPDQSTIISVCTGQQAGVSFELSSTGLLGFPTKRSDTGPSGSAHFTDIPAGPVQLTRAADPVQSMAVFCDGDTSEGNTRPYARYSLTDVQQWFGINLEVLSGERISCDWYVADADSQGDGTVIIRKNACPAGYNASAHDMLDMAANCQSPAGVVAFSVSEAGGGGYDGGMKQTSGGPGGALNSVEFTGVPNVPLWIYEEVPNGFADPVAFCSVESGMTVVVPTRYYPWNAGKIELDAPGEGNVVQCDWYNIPSSGNTVTIRKWECPRNSIMEQTYESHAALCTQSMNGVEFTLTDSKGPRAMTTTGGQVKWTDFATGAITITETVPPGYHPQPFVACGQLANSSAAVVPQPVEATNGVLHSSIELPGTRFFCDWYNSQEPDSTVTIRKWECPQGMEIEQTLSAHQSSCTQPMDNVTFTLTDSKGPRPKMTSGGLVEWTDVQIEPITVAEEIPFGYSTQPFVSCDFDSQNSLSLTDSVINGVLTATLNHPGQRIICHWFNQYLGPGDLTIYKWTCPEGYDYAAWGADPKIDCAEATNGVTFVLDQPAGVDLQTDTGDSINGAVRFGSLTPGDYVVNEIVPQGISEVFVLDCVGLNTGAVHPVPLSYGPTLQIPIAGGDRIECHWYNVPEMDPDFGWMTVTKYTCWTPTYVSDIDCEAFEGGKAFDLQMWNGSSWVGAGSGTTNAAGQLTWTNLAPGAYQVVEQGGTACRITSDPADAVGNPTVNANAGTTVKVYNCGVNPPSTGKTPTKYPNTGVEPVGASDDAPAGSLLAVAGLLGAGSLSRRQFLRRAAAPTIAVGVGSLLVGTGIARQTIAPIELPAGAPATPGADCLFPATPAATPSAASTPVACARGAVPVTITIPVIEVDAGIEVLEIIGGAMQQPTNAEEVAWYKESARLGERGNVLLAGHLNFWGVPEGVFYLLRQLQEGDAVELEGDDGEVYRYIVQWSEDFPSDQEPPEEALGQTEEEAITLITCGGDWNIGRAEYDHRTVVRAVRDTEAPEGTPVATPGA